MNKSTKMYILYFVDMVTYVPRTGGTPNTYRTVEIIACVCNSRSYIVKKNQTFLLLLWSKS